MKNSLVKKSLAWILIFLLVGTSFPATIWAEEAVFEDSEIITAIAELDADIKQQYFTTDDQQNPNLPTEIAATLTITSWEQVAVDPNPPAGEGEGDNPPAGEGDGDNPPAGEGDGDNPPAGEGDGDNPPAGEGDGVNPPAGEGEGDNPQPTLVWQSTTSSEEVELALEWDIEQELSQDDSIIFIYTANAQNSGYSLAADLVMPQIEVEVYQGSPPLELPAAITFSAADFALFNVDDNSNNNDFGIDQSTPSDFKPNDGVHVFGTGDASTGSDDQWYNINPTHELVLIEPHHNKQDAHYSLFDYNRGDPSMPSASYTDPTVQGGFGGNGANFFNQASTQNAYRQESLRLRTSSGAQNSYRTNYNNSLLYGASIAYDPNGTGQDDHIAYYGFDPNNDYRTTLIRSDADINPLSSGTRTILHGGNEGYSYIKNAQYHEVEGYTSIVAGDFDGDGKDTIMLYDPIWTVYGLREMAGDETAGYNMPSFTALGNNPYYSLGHAAGTSGIAGAVQYVYGNNIGNAGNDVTISHPNAYLNVPYVHMAAGDLDGDFDDEIVLTMSFGNAIGNYEQNNPKDFSTIFVMNKVNGQWVVVFHEVMDEITAINPNNSYDSAINLEMRSASSQIGDFIGNDGINEIVTIGLADNNRHTGNHYTDNLAYTDRMLAAITQYNPAANSYYSDKSGAAINGHFLMFNANTGHAYNREPSDIPQIPIAYANIAPLSSALVRFDGYGTQEYLVAYGVVFRYEDGSFIAADFTENATQIGEIFDGAANYVYRATVGNFSGDLGKESVLFGVRSHYTDSWRVHVAGYHKAIADDADIINGGDLLSAVWTTDSNIYNQPLLIAVDYDNDAELLRFMRKEYTFIDPEIMAVLEIAPYFKGLAYPSGDAAATIWGQGNTQGTGEMQSFGAHAGAYVSYTFGVKNNTGSSIEVAYDFAFTHEEYTENTVERSMSFSVGDGLDHEVALISTPVTLYYYEALRPNGQKDEVVVHVPDDPRYGVITLSNYNEAATKHGYPIIPTSGDEAWLSSTPGDPESYRGGAELETNGYFDGKNYQTVTSEYVNVPQGTSFIEQTLTAAKTTTVSKTFNHSITITGEASKKGFTVGVSGGADFGHGTVELDTSSTSRTGGVAAVPNGLGDDYGYAWKFITWDETFTNSKGEEYTVPVLGYLVREDSVRSLPSPPEGLTAETLSSSEVNLSWQYDADKLADGIKFNVYRFYNNGYIKLTPDPIADLEYNHTSLAAKTTYTYMVEAVETENIQGTPITKVSLPSEHVSATTFTDAAGAGVSISSHPDDQDILVGANATFAVTAATSPVGGSLSYQWEAYIPGGSPVEAGVITGVWADIDGATQASYTFTNGQLGHSGYQFRCKIINPAATDPLPVRTNIATLTVSELKNIVPKLTVEVTNSDGDNINLLDANGAYLNPAPTDTLVEGEYFDVTLTLTDAGGDPLVGKTLQLRHDFQNDPITDNNPTFSPTHYRGSISDANGQVTFRLPTTDYIPAPEHHRMVAIFPGEAAQGGNPGLDAVYASPVQIRVQSGYKLSGLSDSYFYLDKIEGVTVNDALNAPLDAASYKLQAFAQVGNGWSATAETAGASTALADLSLIPGNYQIRAYRLTDNALLAQQDIAVVRKPIKVIAPDYTTEITDITAFNTDTLYPVVKNTNSEEFILNNSAYGTAANGYNVIFDLIVAQHVDGYYLVPDFASYTLDVADEPGRNALIDFQSKYQPEFVPSAQLNVAGFKLHTVTFSNTGSGSLVANSDIGGFFPSATRVFSGANISFNAQGEGGNAPTVNSWAVNGTAITVDNMVDYGMTSPTATTLTIDELAADTNVVANLETNTYPVTINGSRAANTGAASYESGSLVTIYAGSPESGYRFSGWVGNIAPTNATATTTTFVMPAYAINLTATWQNTTRYDVTVNGSQGVVSTGEGTYLAGEQVDIDAGSLAGYTFNGWQAVGITLANSSQAKTSFIMPANDVDLRATWVSTSQGAYTVTVLDSYDPFSGAGKYDRNNMVTLKAGSREGYSFDGWTISNPAVTIISPNDATTFFQMPADNVTVTANWRQNSSPNPNPNPGPSPGPNPAPVPDPDPNEKETIITIIEIREIIRETIRNSDNRETIIIDSPTPITSIPTELFSEAMEFGEIIINTPAAMIGIDNNSFGSLASLGGHITVYASVVNNEDGTATADLSIMVNGTALREVPGGISIAFPYTAGSPTTVAKLLYADGTYGIIPKSIADDEMISIHLSGPSSLLIEDNTQVFDDIVANYWAAEDIAFVTSHGLFLGVAPTIFDATDTMSRSMLWTVLARMEGVDTEGGTTWYSKGRDWAIANDISNGSDPTAAISRESLVTMLWRTAGSPMPESDSSISFDDSDQISGYAADAMDWAITVGIINGKSEDIIDPLGGASRAEVSAIIRRFMIMFYY